MSAHSSDAGMHMSTATPVAPLSIHLSESDFIGLAQKVFGFVLEQLRTAEARGRTADVDGDDVLRGVELIRQRALPEQGQPFESVVPDLRMAFTRTVSLGSPGSFGFIPGGGIPSAALADFIATALNRYVGMTMLAPVAVEIERTAIRWLATLIGWPSDSHGILTTGGSMSNLCAVVAARVQGLGEDATGGVLYCSDQTHCSVQKAAFIAGLPRQAVRLIRTDAAFRLDVGALEAAIQEDRRRGLRPFMVVVNLGTTNTGSVDPVPATAAVCARYRLWLHGDGAYGGLFAMTRTGAERLRGIQQCDSVSLDPHKTLYLPYGTGCLLVHRPEALLRAFTTHAEYLRDLRPPQPTAVGTAEATGTERAAAAAAAAAGAPGSPSVCAPAEPNFFDLSPEMSRDFRGLRVWLPLRLHGAAPFRAQLEEKLQLAARAAAFFREDGRFELACPPALTVVVFRLRRPSDGPAADAQGDSDDELNGRLLHALNRSGRIFLSSTVLRGRTYLRLCILSYRTHALELQDALQLIGAEAATLVGLGRPLVAPPLVPRL